ncbi:MAG: hypothetical protein IJL05_00900 [Alphaproteobacteria bacterium]|nr:hypothetical protein [Alphaproteobacteria bacterium]
MSDKEKQDNEWTYKIRFSISGTVMYAIGLASGTANQMLETSTNIDWNYLISNTVQQSALVFSGSIGVFALLDYVNKKRGR